MTNNNMLDKEQTGLVVVDVQGKLARMVQNSDKVIDRICQLIRGCQILSLPIVLLEQYPKGLGRTVPEIKELLSDTKPIEKNTFDACQLLLFNETLQKSQRKQWLVCGIETHICVYQTVCGLLAQDYQVELVSDCVSSRSQNSVDLGIKKILSKGANITNVEMCLYELVQDSQAKEFKKILSLIK